jgi:hypothetical protein
MESVSFDQDPNYSPAKASAKRKMPFFTSLVLSCGFAKTAEEANRVLVIVAVIGLIVTAYFTYVVVVPPHSIIPQAILEANNARLLKGRPQ